MAGTFRIQDGPPTAADADAEIRAAYDLAAPTSGGRVDGVEVSEGQDGVHNRAFGASGLVPACPGRCARVTAGGTFFSGDELATDANGRAVEATTGDTVVAVALQPASGSGQEAWIVFVTQREL